MGALADVRAGLTAALTGAVVVDGYALPVIDEIPEGFEPPALWILPADAYIDATGLPFGRATIAYDLLAIYRTGTNPNVSATLEDLAEQLIDAIYPLKNWVLAQVGKPVDVPLSTGVPYPAVRCTVSLPAARITST